MLDQVRRTKRLASLTLDHALGLISGALWCDFNQQVATCVIIQQIRYKTMELVVGVSKGFA